MNKINLQNPYRFIKFTLTSSCIITAIRLINQKADHRAYPW